ncbi:unnamed protein product [Mytilus edulis]|uniref:Uncharacterized protein n=1 Tax=Mytilus edulis TaxID=6550 RepID=A0A8S3TAU5_MYTED|nr:unnamed protein product [Mytilus edulis]
MAKEIKARNSGCNELSCERTISTRYTTRNRNSLSTNDQSVQSKQSGTIQNLCHTPTNLLKAASRKIDASNRALDVETEVKFNNIILTFTAGAYEQFKSALNGSLIVAKLNTTTTTKQDRQGLIVEESISIRPHRKQAYRINCYHTTSRVMINDNVNIFTEMLCNIIDTSAKECAKPNKQKSRPRKRYWPDEIKKACCENKHHFWKWKMAGRPRDQENIHFRNMKNGKRKLRSTQRQLEAVARKQKFENIMTAREEEQVEKVINTLKSGKAADCANLTSEHLKNGGQIVISAVTKLINMIFHVCSIPDLLKLGIATPAFKRKGKPLDDPNSYRKITVTSILKQNTRKIIFRKER